MNCSTVPLPLLLLVGHENLTNNGNGWRDGGRTEEDRKQKAGNRVLEETAQSEHAETERRLWSSFWKCGKKNWKLAMQLKETENLAAAAGTITLKHTQMRTHTLSMPSPLTRLLISLGCGHLPAHDASSGCDQYPSLGDCG